jgi:hypothetical protein
MRACPSLVLLALVVQEPGDRVVAERQRNELAYREQYLPKQQEMHAKHEGRWLVIAGGRVGSPRATLEEADAAAREASPRARHRFVLRIGEEGDQKWDLGMAEGKQLAGFAMTNGLGDKCFVHAAGVVVEKDGKQVEIGQVQDKGGACIEPEVMAPRAERGQGVKMLFTNIMQGPATIERRVADELGLAMWELPGMVELRPGYGQVPVAPVATCRRAWVRVWFAPLERAVIVPVAIWGE